MYTILYPLILANYARRSLQSEGAERNLQVLASLVRHDALQQKVCNDGAGCNDGTGCNDGAGCHTD